MFNKVVLVGNLTRDIEMRYAPSGTAIGATGIAVTRKMTVNGEKREETCFVDITFWGRTAEVANQYLSKGSKVLIEGRLRFEQWNDQNGQTRSKHTVSVENMEMLGSSPNSQNPAQNLSYNQGQGGYNQNYNQTKTMSGDPYSNQPVNQPTKQAQKPAQQPPQQEKLREIDVDNFEADDSELPF